MLRGFIELNKNYLNTYNNKICKVIFKYIDGDCDVKYNNNKKDRIHCSYIEEIIS